MITDTIAPVVTPLGIATISTVSGKGMLSKGLVFHQTNVSINTEKVGSVYGVKYGNENLKYLYVTKDAFLYTIDGWKSIVEIVNGFDADKTDYPLYNKILGLFDKCILCGNLYVSSRYSFSTCSNKCMTVTGKKNKAYSRTIDGSNVKDCFEEGWMSIERISLINYHSQMEVLNLDSVKDANGIYINNLMISTKKIIESGYD